MPEGAIYALVGANGAGKTTLIKLLMNILRPTCGHGEGAGRRLVAKLAGSFFNRIGYVSENQELPEGMTVGEMLDYFRGRFIRHGIGRLKSSWCGSSICRSIAS